MTLIPETVVACAEVPMGTDSQCPPPQALVVQFVPTTVTLPLQIAPVAAADTLMLLTDGARVTVRLLHCA